MVTNKNNHGLFRCKMVQCTTKCKLYNTHSLSNARECWEYFK